MVSLIIETRWMCVCELYNFCPMCKLRILPMCKATVLTSTWTLVNIFCNSTKTIARKPYASVDALHVYLLRILRTSVVSRFKLCISKFEASAGTVRILVVLRCRQVDCWYQFSQRPSFRTRTTWLLVEWPEDLRRTCHTFWSCIKVAWSNVDSAVLGLGVWSSLNFSTYI